MKTQTLNLLKKEITLGNSLQTIIWTICCFGMYFIPNYPSYIGMFYITLGIMMTFALNQSSHDILYTALLPARKIDVVKARFLFCALLEVFAFASALLACFIRGIAAFPENRAGIDLNFCYFGLQLIILSLFNLIFLGNVYKDPIKPGLRYLIAAIVYFVSYALCELPVWAYFAMRTRFEEGELSELPALAKLGLVFTSSETQYIIPQLVVLASGIVFYAAVWFITFRRASRQFEKYDL